MLVITRYTVGSYVSFRRTKAGQIAFNHERTTWLLDDTRTEVKDSDTEYLSTDPERGPFERSDFGDRERLKWAAGVCAMRTEPDLIFWSQRYVLWTEAKALHLVDATRPLVVRLGLPIQIAKIDRAVLHAGTLYLQTDRHILVVAAADLEALFDRTTGTLDVRVREVYPLRRPDAKLSMKARWKFRDEVSLEYANGHYSLLKIPDAPGIEEGAPVTLYNALAPDYYLEYSTLDTPRAPLHDLNVPDEHAGSFELRVEPAVDPAGTLVQASATARVDDLDRVFRQLADDPEDEAARMVVVDLLEDAGEPYAATFAKLLAGDQAARADALGTLASYLTGVEWRGNFPRGATLSADAPLDDELGALVLADHRLGFLHTLRLGDGNFGLYAKLIASPRAVGLRHVDGARVPILKALIAADRRDLRRLSSLKFVNRETIEALAQPTFDGVVEVETETQHRVADRLLDFIARDEAQFFHRARRSLILRERDGHDLALAAPVIAAWPRLPLEHLTFGGITIGRDGIARTPFGLQDDIAALLARQFRVEALHGSPAGSNQSS